MTRIIGLFLYVSSVLGLLGVAAQLSSLAALFPPSHLSTYGPRVPHISQAQAGWIPYASLVLSMTALLSILAGMWLWRFSRLTPQDKTFALAAVAALNYFIGMCVATAVLAFWFVVPKAANMV
ncbi:hypothetical protein [Stenotrophomonas sp.]|uniref:hypothetical protein n=1 Tax=Stenotrophomonas sp. TaxID=69392 RepID=UPI002898C6E8|nr:hypothetical protein [Stenotrophomonas sp.]